MEVIDIYGVIVMNVKHLDVVLTHVKNMELTLADFLLALIKAKADKPKLCWLVLGSDGKGIYSYSIQDIQPSMSSIHYSLDDVIDAISFLVDSYYSDCLFDNGNNGGVEFKFVDNAINVNYALAMINVFSLIGYYSDINTHGGEYGSIVVERVSIGAGQKVNSVNKTGYTYEYYQLKKDEAIQTIKSGMSILVMDDNGLQYIVSEGDVK